VATSEEAAQPRAWCAHRRVLLAGLGGLGAVGVLAACGDDAPATTPAQNQAQSPGQSMVPTLPSPTGSAKLAATADVPVGGGVVVDGLLIVQPERGTFKAYDAACPHKGVLVTAPENGIAKCPAHSSTFSITDGAKIAGPSQTGLKAIPVKVDGANIMRGA
jgi:nitrite reductase/ring-hydroxylating ferredoxin subunit